METRVSFKYFVNGSLWKNTLAFNSPMTPPHLFFFFHFGNSKTFQPKIRANNFEKTYFVTTFPIFSVRSKYGIKTLSSLF